MTLCALSPVVIARAAADALREELLTYPKPGLVSFVDNGSHPGLDADCFLASIVAISPYFAQMADSAGNGASLGDLRHIGLAAEAAMFAATSGRNTHKGAIFCMGLLAAAAGVLHEESQRALGEIVRERWGGEIVQAGSLPETSAGIMICRKYGIGGVRREAADGFPSIYRRGLPALRASPDRKAARVQAFFALLDGAEDTTLLKRGGLDGHEFAQARVRAFLDAGGIGQASWKESAQEIHREFVARNLTAGGVADLLAATVFVEKIENLI
jgi:triphosphoribosyl-dephospho-CoA synthase